MTKRILTGFSIGLVWGAISYPAIYVAFIPLVGLLALPSLIAGAVINRFNLPLSRDFGQYWNFTDFTFVTISTALIAAMVVFLVNLFFPQKR